MNSKLNHKIYLHVIGDVFFLWPVWILVVHCWALSFAKSHRWKPIFLWEHKICPYSHGYIVQRIKAKFFDWFQSITTISLRFFLSQQNALEECIQIFKIGVFENLIIRDLHIYQRNQQPTKLAMWEKKHSSLFQHTAIWSARSHLRKTTGDQLERCSHSWTPVLIWARNLEWLTWQAIC